MARQRQSVERAAAEQYLAEVAGRLTADGIRCQSSVAEGPAATAILEQVKETNPSLIAMATHGRGGLGRLFFGSVADEVLRKTSVPLFLVRGS